jgi:hypothetical protein
MKELRAFGVFSLLWSAESDVKIKIYKTIISIFFMGVEFGLPDSWINRSRLSENTVLRRIYGHKKDEVTGGKGKLHSGEHHNLCCSSYIIRIIKSRRVGWAGHVACMGGRCKMHTKLWLEGLKV